MTLKNIEVGKKYLFFIIPRYPIIPIKKKDGNYAAYGTILQIKGNLLVSTIKTQFEINGKTRVREIIVDRMYVKESQHFISLGNGMYVTTHKYYAYQLIKKNFCTLARIPIAKAKYIYESLYNNYRVMINQLKKL